MGSVDWESELDPEASYNYANLKTLRLEPDDFQEAMGAFEEKFKRKPAAIGLHKRVSGKVKAAAEEQVDDRRKKTTSRLLGWGSFLLRRPCLGG